MNRVTLFWNCVTVAANKGQTFTTLKIFGNLNFEKVNAIESKGTWEEQKGKLKQKFAVLTDNDLMFEEGNKDEMFGKLQITPGKTKEELQKIIETL